MSAVVLEFRRREPAAPAPGFGTRISFIAGIAERVAVGLAAGKAKKAARHWSAAFTRARGWHHQGRKFSECLELVEALLNAYRSDDEQQIRELTKRIEDHVFGPPLGANYEPIMVHTIGVSAREHWEARNIRQIDEMAERVHFKLQHDVKTHRELKLKTIETQLARWRHHFDSQAMRGGSSEVNAALTEFRIRSHALEASAVRLAEALQNRETGESVEMGE